jgi:predicted Zn-dependent peptidase
MFHDVYDGFEQLTLPNGLTIYCKEQPDVNWFYAAMVIHAGAREDSPGREGLAHLVEHLVGENVSGLTFPQLEKRFEALGGYGWFGTTGYLSTKYKFHLPNKEKNVQEAFSLFGQMLLMGQLTQKIEEEKAIILHEYHRRYEHNEARAWSLQGRPFLFEEHPRLKTFDSAIGIAEEFMPITYEEVQGFYDHYYVPYNMSLLCLGPMTMQTILHLLQQTPFSVQKPGQRTSPSAAFSLRSPRIHEKTVRLSDFSTLTQSTAACSFEWVLPLCFTRHIVRIFCDMLEELLTEELRYKRGMTYGVDVTNEYWQDCRTLSISFEVPPDARETAKTTVTQLLRSIPDHAYERFLEAKREWLACIYRMDYSGYQLLNAGITDLEQHHRLIPFLEEITHIEQTTFDHIVDLALYLTPERQFSFFQVP